MYITKRPKIAHISEEADVDWIFVDMKFIISATLKSGPFKY